MDLSLPLSADRQALGEQGEFYGNSNNNSTGYK